MGRVLVVLVSPFQKLLWSHVNKLNKLRESVVVIDWIIKSYQWLRRLVMTDFIIQFDILPNKTLPVTAQQLELVPSRSIGAVTSN